MSFSAWLRWARWAIASVMVSLGVTGAADFSNPIMRGDWSDPGVIRVGEDFYSVRSSFGWQPGLPIVASKDLIRLLGSREALAGVNAGKDPAAIEAAWQGDLQRFRQLQVKYLIY